MPALAPIVSMSRPAVVLGVLGGCMVAATVALWAFYGTTVFFEVIRAGWMACF